jgi:hypothetical protein
MTDRAGNPAPSQSSICRSASGIQHLAFGKSKEECTSPISKSKNQKPSQYLHYHEIGPGHASPETGISQKDP